MPATLSVGCASRWRISGGDTVSLLVIYWMREHLHHMESALIEKILKGFPLRTQPSCYFFRSFRFYFPLIFADCSCRWLPSAILNDISKRGNNFIITQINSSNNNKIINIQSLLLELLSRSALQFDWKTLAKIYIARVTKLENTRPS